MQTATQEKSQNSTETTSGEERLQKFASLIILARDVRPATILSHIVIFAHILQVPILILPGQASSELGDVLGIKSVAAAIFLSSGSQTLSSDEAETDTHNDVDSFVHFAATNIK